MEREELLELLAEIKRLSAEAGCLILACRDKELSDTEHKPDGSPVTLADREAHDFLERGLRRLDSSIQLISEEDSPGSATATNDICWLVDPLDGTLGYLRSDGQFTVNIALVERGEVLAGAIHAPATGQTYAAARGTGSFREDKSGEVLVLDGALASGPLTAALTNTNHSGRMGAFLEANRISGQIKCSSSLKICYVAERRADIYPRFGRTALWDTAAGAVIAREAGCVVADLRGKPLSYDPTSGVYHHGFMVYDPARIRPVINIDWL